MLLREYIRRIREARGYSQEYVAAHLNISQNSYCKLENGAVKLKVEALQKIVQILDVDIVEVLSILKNGEAPATYEPLNHFFRGKDVDLQHTLYKQIIMSKEAELRAVRNLLTAREEQLWSKNEEIERLKIKIKQLEKKERAAPGME